MDGWEYWVVWTNKLQYLNTTTTSVLVVFSGNKTVVAVLSLLPVLLLLITIAITITGVSTLLLLVSVCFEFD